MVLELFTSQSCSSCPPADALLGRLKGSQPSVLPLSLHVDYWNRIGWQDRYSSHAITARQYEYARLLGQDGVYTPELVVDGLQGVVGSDPFAVDAAIRRAQAARAERPAIVLGIRRDGADVTVEAGAGAGQGTLLLVGYDDRHVTPVGSGENAGRTLTEINVVRSIAPLGAWAGAPLALRVAAPPGEHYALLLQSTDGRMLAARAVP